jgi:hypothetical protein
MNIFLFGICLLYFFTLVFRFQDIFGSDDFNEAFIAANRQPLPKQNDPKTKKAKQG